MKTSTFLIIIWSFVIIVVLKYHFKMTCEYQLQKRYNINLTEKIINNHKIINNQQIIVKQKSSPTAIADILEKHQLKSVIEISPYSIVRARNE